MMKRVLMFVFFLVAWFSGSAQEARSFSMGEAVQFGYENHQNMVLGANSVERAREQMIEARAMGIPQLNAGVDYNYFLKLPTSLIPAQFFDPNAVEGDFLELSFGTKNNLTASATLSTLIFDGTYLMALRAGKEYVDLARKNYENIRTNLRNSIKKAYLPPLLIQENINTLDMNISVLEKLYHETDEMYKAGFVEKLDVDKLFLTVDNMKVLRKDLEKNRLLALDALKVQMGYPLSDPIELSASIEELSGELDPAILTQALDYTLRPEYNVVDQSIVLSELNVERYKRGYWPSVSGFLNYQQVVQGDNLFKDPISTPASVAGLSLNVPIFDGLYKKAKIQQAKLDVIDAQLQKEMLASNVDFQWMAAKKNYTNALDNIGSRKRNLELAETIFETARIKYQEGVGSSLEIIQAEQSLHDSQQNYLSALYEFIVAKLDVEMALGRE